MSIGGVTHDYAIFDLTWATDKWPSQIALFRQLFVYFMWFGFGWYLFHKLIGYDIEDSATELRDGVNYVKNRKNRLF